MTDGRRQLASLAYSASSAPPDGLLKLAAINYAEGYAPDTLRQVEIVTYASQAAIPGSVWQVAALPFNAGDAIPDGLRRVANMAINYLIGPLTFTPALGAPLASPYSETGKPGSLTLVQTDGQLSTSGGTLVFPAQATPVFGDQGFYYAPGFARTAGRALLAKFQASTAERSFFGWGRTAGVNTDSDGALYFSNGALLLPLSAGAGEVGGGAGSWATGTLYEGAVVLRSVGYFTLVKGGAYATWTLLWVTPLYSQAVLYPNFSNYANVGTLDDFRVVNLPGAWASDYGIATMRLAGARTAGDTFTHTADCLLEFTDTTIPSASTLDFRFRQQDATNYWQVTVDSTGALTLNEVVAGTPTSRGSSAAAVANGNRIVVIAAGAVIKVYAANALKVTYSLATNFQTATAGVLQALGTTGAVADLIAWPRFPAMPSAY